MSGSLSRYLSAASTGVLVLCALAVTGMVARREFASPSSASAVERSIMVPQKNWRDFIDGGQRLGPAQGRVVLVEFADFQCPACRLFAKRLAETRRHVTTPFAIVYRHLPLDIHPFAQAAAVASECAGRQGRFEAMHDTLFALPARIGKTEWRAIAKDAGVADLKAFDACLDDPAVAARIKADADAARQLNATGTPTLLVNGVRIAGATSQDMLDSLVREALRTNP